MNSLNELEQKVLRRIKKNKQLKEEFEDYT